MKQFIPWLWTALMALPAQADQILVLSGGGTPSSNHYSQYLQTKTLTDDLRNRSPFANIEVLFGAGNSYDRAPILADVHRVIRTEAGQREVLLAGAIEKNSAATKANVERYFSQPKMSSMAKNENLFLFVSDHGMPNQLPDGSDDKSYDNNCIDLWGFEVDVGSQKFYEAPNQERCLSRVDLQSHLENKVKAGRVVFAMSQCYSGGFHKMSVQQVGKYPSANPRICGFTAVTEDTTASGCTPDVDGPNYQGYERSFTQQLTGVDIVSGQRLRPARSSIVETHREATIEDLAKDIPLATSDFYLWKWAQTIDKASFTPRTRFINAKKAKSAAAVAQLGKSKLKDTDYLSKEAFFARMQKKLLELYPEYQKAFTGSLKEHKALEAQLAEDLNGVEGQVKHSIKAYFQLRTGLLQQWTFHVSSGKSKLSDIETYLERDIFGAADTQMGPGSADELAIYLMATTGLNDPELAKNISDYKANRENLALSWASKSGHSQLVQVARALEVVEKNINELSEKYTNLQKRHGHVRRLLIYRQALGAWNALHEMRDTKALSELKALIECEQTPLEI